jgi:hypothetical protein
MYTQRPESSMVSVPGQVTSKASRRGRREKREDAEGPWLPSASSQFPLRPLRETFFFSKERYRTTTEPFIDGWGSQW